MINENNPVIAEKDITLTDPASGLDHKVFAGTPVPGFLLEAYEDKTGGKAKAQRAPAKDKAQDGPSASK